MPVSTVMGDAGMRLGDGTSPPLLGAVRARCPQTMRADADNQAGRAGAVGCVHAVQFLLAVQRRRWQ
jgi:hypothetical protein